MRTGPISVGVSLWNGGTVGPQRFGPLLYSYGSELVVTSGAEVLSMLPMHGSLGPTLAIGGGTPEIGSWGYGGQRDVRGTTAADGRSGDWTRPTAVGDFTIACAFQRMEAANGRVFLIRKSAVGTPDTTIIGAISAMGDGTMYWYVAPVGAVVTGQAGSLSIGTRHVAIIRRVGSTASIYLDGTLLASGDAGATAIPGQVESVHFLDDPRFSQTGRQSARSLHMWPAAVDVASLQAWMKSTYGTV